MSVAEKIFWELARGHRLGFEIRRQHPVEQYTLDFYCKEASLDIEFDGEQHCPEDDERRDEALRAMGIETIRIPNREFFMIDVNEPSNDWINAIVSKCEERSGRKAFPDLPTP